MELLLKSCDKNNDNRIDYVEFSNFLNWKDKMPAGLSVKLDKNANNEYEQKIIEKSKDSGLDVTEKGQSEPTLLRKQVDNAQVDYQTSSSMINGSVFNDFTKCKLIKGFLFALIVLLVCVVLSPIMYLLG